MSDAIEFLASHAGCEVLRRSDVEAFLARNARALLFFAGDVSRRPEGLDVAVVVRELLEQHAGQLRAGLVDSRDETALMPRFGIVVLPAIAFMREGKTAELVTRMRDWPVYAQACDRLLADGAMQTLDTAGGKV